MKKISIFFVLALLILPVFTVNAEELSGRLKGRILLQVQSHGEAWYINPESQTRFYLGRPADAFSVMRAQGLGVSNKDFDSFKGYAPVRLAGKILLKVESKGEAYYVNPVDLKMYYLGRPDDAFSIMRTLGLGIANNDLVLILVDTDSSPLITEEISKEEAAPATSDIGQPNQETDGTATTTEEIIGGEVTATSTTSCVWHAEYYDNYKLTGDPVLTRDEDKINYNWGVGIPDGLNKKDQFSVRWTATCSFAGGTYEFRTVFDDAIKVYLDGENFLQSWANNAREMKINRERPVTEGEHTIKVEYYEQSGNAKAIVDWVKI